MRLFRFVVLDVLSEELERIFRALLDELAQALAQDGHDGLVQVLAHGHALGLRRRGRSGRGLRGGLRGGRVRGSGLVSGRGLVRGSGLLGRRLLGRGGLLRRGLLSGRGLLRGGLLGGRGLLSGGLLRRMGRRQRETKKEGIFRRKGNEGTRVLSCA